MEFSGSFGFFPKVELYILFVPMEELLYDTSFWKSYNWHWGTMIYVYAPLYMDIVPHMPRSCHICCSMLLCNAYMIDWLINAQLQTLHHIQYRPYLTIHMYTKNEQNWGERKMEQCHWLPLEKCWELDMDEHICNCSGYVFKICKRRL